VRSLVATMLVTPIWLTAAAGSMAETVEAIAARPARPGSRPATTGSYSLANMAGHGSDRERPPTPWGGCSTGSGTSGRVLGQAGDRVAGA
jgi:hypothetical protein